MAKQFWYLTALIMATVLDLTDVTAEDIYPVTSKSLVYSQHDRPPRSLSMTVYRTDGNRRNDRASAIVFFHGGGWVSGGANQFRKQAEILAQRGMVVASVEYPLDGNPVGATRVAQTALCWFRRNAESLNVDLTRIAVSGGSAGGQLAVAGTLMDRASNPVCADLNGPLANALILFNPVLDMKGKWEDKFKADLHPVSPIDMLAQPLPPTLILQGDADRVTPLSTAEAFASKARTLGSPLVTVRVYKGRGHGFFNRQEFDTTMSEVVSFFNSLGWIP